jgi:hypothetical protein
MKNKMIKRKLVEQMASLSLAHLQIFKECLDEIMLIRAPEFQAKESVQVAAKSKGIKLKDDQVGEILIIVSQPEKKKQVSPAVKGSKFFLVAGDSLTVVSRKSKAEALIRSGANVMPYESLPEHLKSKADELLA